MYSRFFHPHFTHTHCCTVSARCTAPQVAPSAARHLPRVVPLAVAASSAAPRSTDYSLRSRLLPAPSSSSSWCTSLMSPNLRSPHLVPAEGRFALDSDLLPSNDAKRGRILPPPEPPQTLPYQSGSKDHERRSTRRGGQLNTGLY